MARWRIVGRRLILALAAAALSAAGCSQKTFYTRTIPEDASPVYKWHGSRSGLQTYWGKLDVAVNVSAYFPDNWKKPGDGYWNVQAQTAKGKNIPFLGVVRRYVNDGGTELAVLVPEVDLDNTRDWLYFLIDPNVAKKGGKLVSIRPVARLREIRGHAFKPFENKVYLVPQEASDLTPMPQLPPEQPKGTPIGVD